MNNYLEGSVRDLFSDNYICNKCRKRMVFEDDERSILVCLSCGESITLDEYLGWDRYDVISEPECNIPEGCLACGGPYPECTTSCKLFDD